MIKGFEDYESYSNDAFSTTKTAKSILAGMTDKEMSLSLSVALFGLDFTMTARSDQ
jgi:hypothetical protein